MTRDYKRNGTTTLFAALNVLDGGARAGRARRRGRAGLAAGFMPRLWMQVRIQSGTSPASMHAACGARPMAGMTMPWGWGACGVGATSAMSSGERSQAASVRPNRQTSRARIRAASPVPGTRTAAASARRAARRQAAAVAWVGGKIDTLG